MEFKNMSLNDIEKEGYRLYHIAGKNTELWRQCTDCFLYLMEYGVRADKKAQYANTLGYIYYYGRVNDFKPEYDKAFKYFSIGAEGGFYESKYKLGDMYLNGYYVEKNPEEAVRLYTEVYDDVEPQFREEHFTGVFADIALRLGSLYRNGIGCRQNDKKALFIYTMADYAIKERMKYEDFFGNQKVADSISKELSELQEKLGVDTQKKVTTSDCPQALPLALAGGFCAYVYFKKKGDNIVIDIERELYDLIEDIDEMYNESAVPVIFSEYGYIEFLDVVEETAVGVTEFECVSDHEEDGYEIYIDEIRYDDKTGRYEFCLEGKVQAAIKAQRFEYRLRE